MSKFTDVPQDHWARADIEEAARLGLVGGYPDGTYRPEQPITRAEEAAIEVRQVRRLFALFNAASVTLREQVAPAVIHIDAGNAVGSGVIISPNGLVVTCDHVVANATALVARTAGWPGHEWDMPVLELVMRRPEQDLALCRIRGLPSEGAWQWLRLGAAPLRPGELVTVIGSPSGLAAWQSMGIVARPEFAAQYYTGPQVLMSLSAAVNPGNSGGAVIDADTGELAGIASMKLVDVSIEGMAFAVPVTEVERLVADAFQAGVITDVDWEGAA